MLWSNCQIPQIKALHILDDSHFMHKDMNTLNKWIGCDTVVHKEQNNDREMPDSYLSQGAVTHMWIPMDARVHERTLTWINTLAHLRHKQRRRKHAKRFVGVIVITGSVTGYTDLPPPPRVF